MESGRILGVELGDARTGLALSDPSGFLAGGIGMIQSGWMEGVAKEVAKTAQERGAVKIVVGMPVNMNGTQGPRCEKVQAFCALLRGMTEIPVELFDERLSTCEAHRFLSETGTRGKKRRGVVDTLSAQIILQDYLDRQKKEREKGKEKETEEKA